MISWIPVIINPAAGPKTAVLSELNRIFSPVGIRWSVEVTQGLGDGTRLAANLVAQGAQIVAAYGGDGTISEVAGGLAGTNTALGILPGGTGNVLAYEFNIPRDLMQAGRLLYSEHRLRTVDMGDVNGRKFLLRAGAGFEAITTQFAPRETKDRFGMLAYGMALLQALMEAYPVQYSLDLDGQNVEVHGILCTVANAGHLGMLPFLSISPPIDIEDGLLDVVVLDRLDLRNIIAVLTRNLDDANHTHRIQHWRVHQAIIRANPTQATQVDGDELGFTPMTVCSLPRCLKVVTPF